MNSKKSFLAVFLGSKASAKMTAWNALTEVDRSEKVREGMAAWKAWAQTHQAVIATMGGPLGKTKRVSSAGVEDVTNAMSAFCVVEAESQKAAAALFVDHPHFTIFPGESVEVMPVLPIPEEAARITVEAIVAAPVEQVWRAYTTPDDITQWNAASEDWHTTNATVDLREGGQFSSRMEAKDGSMGFDFAGTYTKIIKHRLIEYSFGGRTAKVEFTDEANGVRIRVTFDSEGTHPIEQQKAGWQAILNNFARYVEAKRKGA